MKNLELRAELPTLGKYTIGEELAKILVHEILTNKPKVILEAGSGVSTVLSAYCIEKNGFGKIISLDHLSDYINETNNMLLQHKLNHHNIQLIHAPICEYKINNENYNWYSIDNLNRENLKIDLLIVDGPPRPIGKLVRYPILPLFYKYISKNCTIILDDANRNDEKEIIARWLKEFPNLKIEIFNTEKGAAVFRLDNQ